MGRNDTLIFFYEMVTNDGGFQRTVLTSTLDKDIYLDKNGFAFILSGVQN